MKVRLKQKSKSRIWQILLSFILIAASDLAGAQYSHALRTQVKAPSPATLRTSVTMETAHSLHNPNDFRKYVDGIFRMSSTYTTASGLTFSGNFSISQGTREGGSTLLSDVVFRSGYNVGELFGGIHWTPDVALTAPTSQASQEISRLYTAIDLRNSFRGSFPVFGHSFTLSYAPTVKRNFHQHTINAFGSPNLEYMLYNTVGLSTQITSATTLFANYSQVRGWTYSKFERDLYQSIFGIQHAFTKDISVAGSFSTGGPAFKPNGLDSNISFFNLRDTIITGGLTYVF